MWANDPEMAKKWEKKEKMKKETKVKNLIRKMVREIMSEMNEGGPGSGRPKGKTNKQSKKEKETGKHLDQMDAPDDYEDSMDDLFRQMDEDFAGAYPKHMRKSFDKKRQKQSEVLGYKLMGTPDVKTEIDDATVKEATKRDYKAEYKKYGSSTKAKKYRAELNKYNRQKGTYGNGDKKDASHKGGKIVGFEEQSKNRGRREKSRLKKEAHEVGFSKEEMEILHKNGKLEKDGHIYLYKEGKLSEITAKHKDFFLNQIEKDVKSLKGQVTYAKDALRQPDIEKWEKKEFESVLKDASKDLKDMLNRLKKVKKWPVSEGKLNEEKPYETILKQLGGNKFIAMTGAKNLGTSTKKDLSFSIGRNSKGVTHVIIKLTSMDLYDMEFINMRGPKRKVIKKVKGVYADMLQKIFTKYTGLRTRL